MKRDIGTCGSELCPGLRVGALAAIQRAGGDSNEGAGGIMGMRSDPEPAIRHVLEPGSERVLERG